MGINNDSLEPGIGDMYRNTINKIDKCMFFRAFSPHLYSDIMYKLFGYKSQLDALVQQARAFTNTILTNRMKAFLKEYKHVQIIKDENM